MVEKGPKNSGKAPPPFSGNARKKEGFSYMRCSLMSETAVIYCEFIGQIKTVSVIHKHPLSEKLPEESWSAELQDLRFVVL